MLGILLSLESLPPWNLLANMGVETDSQNPKQVQHRVLRRDKGCGEQINQEQGREGHGGGAEDKVSFLKEVEKDFLTGRRHLSKYLKNPNPVGIVDMRQCKGSSKCKGPQVGGYKESV